MLYLDFILKIALLVTKTPRSFTHVKTYAYEVRAASDGENPFFNGRGRQETQRATDCGAGEVGVRVGAKNSLDDDIGENVGASAVRLRRRCRRCRLSR